MSTHDYDAAIARVSINAKPGPMTRERAEWMASNACRATRVHARRALQFMVEIAEAEIAQLSRGETGEPVSLDLLTLVLQDAVKACRIHEQRRSEWRIICAGPPPLELPVFKPSAAALARLEWPR